MSSWLSFLVQEKHQPGARGPRLQSGSATLCQETTVLKNDFRSSHCGSVVKNPTSIHEDGGSIPGLAQGVEDPVLPKAVV